MQLAEIFAPVAADLSTVEEELRTLTLQIESQAAPRLSRAGILGNIVSHPFAVPGKRIRPALVLLTAHCVGMNGDARAVTRLAAAVELLHAASLVHDDVIDGADTRRHQTSLNKRFGNRVAVLAGDILYTHFFSLITGLEGVSQERRLELLDLFLDTTKAMCMGEILAQELEKDNLRLEEYVQISSAKTAALFSACCASAATVLGAHPRTVRAFSDFGLSFGLTFQMVDDLLDQDCPLSAGVDLAAQAERQGASARGLVDGLPAGTFRQSLRDLVDFVTAQAHC